LADVEVAKSELDLAALELERAAAGLFYDVLWAEKNVELLQENLQITEKFLEAAAYKFNQGFGSKLDVIKGQIEAARAKRLLKSAEQARLISAGQLKTLLKMNPASRPVLHGDLTQPGVHVAIGLDSLLLAAEQYHPAIQIEKNKLQAAAYQVAVAQLPAKPNFDFELSGGIDDHEPPAELSLSFPLALRDTKKSAQAEAQFQQKARSIALTPYFKFVQSVVHFFFRVSTTNRGVLPMRSGFGFSGLRSRRSR
jgi:outer membrane protein TolC